MTRGYWLWFVAWRWVNVWCLSKRRCESSFKQKYTWERLLQTYSWMCQLVRGLKTMVENWWLPSANWLLINTLPTTHLRMVYNTYLRWFEGWFYYCLSHVCTHCEMHLRKYPHLVCFFEAGWQKGGGGQVGFYPRWFGPLGEEPMRCVQTTELPSSPFPFWMSESVFIWLLRHHAHKIIRIYIYIH